MLVFYLVYFVIKDVIGMDKPKHSGPVQFLLHLVQGVIIGIGGILPGVSGGAMCVIFGVYRPLMETLASPFRFLSDLFHGKKEAVRTFLLLLPVALGIGVGFIGLAGLVDIVMKAHEAQAVCAFIGLILGMVPQLYRDAGEKGRTKGAWAAFIVSFAALTALFLYLRYGRHLAIVPNLGWWVFCGAVWGLNVIVPGTSSSSAMIFLGLYQPMLEGISHLRMDVILPIGVGAILVVFTLSRAVNALFRKYHMMTYHVILGAVLAMVVPIVPLHYASVWDAVLDVVCAAAGFAASLVINRISQKYLHKGGADTQTNDLHEQGEVE